MPEPAVSREDVWEGVAAAGRFWLALEADDDGALIGLLPAAALEYMGATDGLAQRLRDRMGISLEDCQRVGTLTQVAVLPEGRLRPAYTLTDGPQRLPPGAQMLGWRLELVKTEGAWAVDPIRAHTDPAIATYDLVLDRWQEEIGGAG